MPALLLLVLSVLSLLSREVGAWNQQFGDPHSTSYVASNVTYTADWNRSFGTSFNNEQYLQVYNPAVSEQGAIFLPLQPHGMGVSVVAVNPTGKVLWQASLASECTVVTNVLYSTLQKSVFVWLRGKYSVQYIVHIPVGHQCFIWGHSVVTVYP